MSEAEFLKKFLFKKVKITAVDVHAKYNKKDYEIFKTLNDQID